MEIPVPSIMPEGVPRTAAEPEPEPELELLLTEPEPEPEMMVRPVSLSLGSDDDAELSGSESDESEAEYEQQGREALAAFASLNDVEQVQLNNSTGQPLSSLVPEAEARLGLAADVRCACQRSFAQDIDLALLTMTRVCQALELTPGEVTFFSDVSAAWPTEDEAAPRGVHLEEPAPPLLAAELRWPALIGTLRLLSAPNDGGGVVVYDARHRALLRHLALSYGIPWPKVRAAEIARLAELAGEVEMREATGRHHREESPQPPVGGVAAGGGGGAGAQQQKGGWGRSFKVGGAAVLGGAALFATGGLATPLVMGVLGVVGAGGALTAVGGAVFVSTLFGAAGAGLGGYAVSYRTAGVK